MNFEDCIKFANENPASYIATMDGAQPSPTIILSQDS